MKLGFNVGEMIHFYIRNDQIKKPQVSINLKNKKMNINNELKIIEIKKINKSYFKIKKIKNYNYFLERYQKHKYYKYRFIKILNNENFLILIIFRIVKYKKNKVMRVIDSYGNWSKVYGLGYLLKNILIKEKIEYLDFMYYGSNIKHIKNNDFIKKAGNTIIPNYFEPFNGIKNQPLNYCYKSNENYELHKGDADSDRPNQLKN